MTIDGTPEPALTWLLAGNTRSYGGMVQITNRAMIDDGVLDVVLMRRGESAPRHRRWHARAVAAPRSDHRTSRTAAIARVDIRTPGIPYQLDGETCGETPLRIEVAPLALNVIVPAGLRSPLFSG